jgi:hypothetical protein
LGSSVIVLATVQDGKVVLVAGVSADLLGALKAGDIVGSGGGPGRRPRRRPGGFCAGRRHSAREFERGAGGVETLVSRPPSD